MRIPLVAGDPARRVGDDLIDLASLDASEKRIHAGPPILAGSCRSPDCGVAEDVNDSPALLLAAFDADPDLVFDRPAVL
jgi:hypothetical protein